MLVLDVYVLMRCIVYLILSSYTAIRLCHWYNTFVILDDPLYGVLYLRAELLDSMNLSPAL